MVVSKPYWFETGSFSDLVENLKKYIELNVAGLDNPDASTVAEKIRAALKNKQTEVKKVVQKDFGITENVEVTDLGSTNVKVQIGTGGDKKGEATVNVDSQNITIEIWKQAVSGNETDVAKRLAKAVEIAVSGVPKLKSFTIKSGSEDQNDVKDFLIQKLRDSGSEKYKLLVGQLKTNGITENDLTDVNKLQSKLTNVTTAIQELVNSIESIQAARVGDVEVSPEGENKVVVKVKKTDGDEGNNSGSSTVKKNEDKKITENIELEVLLHENLVEHLLETLDRSDENKKKAKAKEIAGNLAKRLSKAAEKTKLFSGNWNPGKELVKSEFGLDDASVTASSTRVEVNAKTGGESNSETVNVKITGSSGGDMFNDLVTKLSEQVKTQLKSQTTLNADKLQQALNQDTVKTAIKDLLKAEFDVTVSSTNDINVRAEDGNKVTVTIGNSGGTVKGEAIVKVEKTGGTSVELKIEVKGSGATDDLTNEEGTAIANVVALAMVDKTVTEAAQKNNYEIKLKDKNKVRFKQINK